MSVVETCRLPVDGGDAVFCEVTGHGPPLVLTHDAILHRESWDAQFESLSRSYRVVRWDRRGYGRSDEPRAPYASDKDLARVVASLTEPPSSASSPHTCTDQNAADSTGNRSHS